jgi:Fe-S-cluster containining protein
MMKSLSGKIIRAASSMVLPVDEKRIGECKRCGACCMFLFKCPFLKFENHGSNKSMCTIHGLRPPQCRKYPRTEWEKAHEPCGYDFVKEQTI